MVVMLYLLNYLIIGLLYLLLGHEFVWTIGFIFQSLITIIHALKVKLTKIQFLAVLISYLLCTVVMLLDLYGKNLIAIPQSGADTEFYYNHAIRVYESILYNKKIIFTNSYSNIIAGLFFVTGPSRLLAQALNILLHIEGALLIFKMLKRLKISNKVVSIALIIYLLKPFSIIFASILLREQMWTFFAIASIYYLFLYIDTLKYGFMIAALLMLLVPLSLHSGAIVLIAVELFFFLFFNPDIKKWKFSVQKVFISIILLIPILFITLNYESIFLWKFQNLDSLEQVTSIANNRRGGSSYLQGLEVRGPLTLLAFSPIRALYFAISPVPIDWRGLNDIFTFFMDSIFYLIGIVVMMKREHIKDKYMNQFSMIIITLIWAFNLFYGLAISNAGTAIRHRNKIFFAYCLVVAIVLSYRERRLENGVSRAR